MAKELPEDMDELVYFTRRKFKGKGSAIAWVNRIECPQCGEGLMSKPRDEKTGKFKTRATSYVCDACGHEENKKEHQEKLTCEIIYECPFCNHTDETDAGFKRKSFYGAKAVVFECAGCGERLGITKKLKMPDKFEEKLE